MNRLTLEPGTWSSQRHWHTHDAILLEIGTNAEGVDCAEYPDIDLRYRPEGFVHRDGTPYPPRP